MQHVDCALNISKPLSRGQAFWFYPMATMGKVLPKAVKPKKREINLSMPASVPHKVSISCSTGALNLDHSDSLAPSCRPIPS